MKKQTVIFAVETKNGVVDWKILYCHSGNRISGWRG